MKTTPKSPDEPSRRTFLRTGLLAGIGVATVGVGSLALPGRALAADSGYGDGWRWCFKCEGFFLGANQVVSSCPAGSSHNGSESADYEIRNNVSDNSPQPQGRWRRCIKCEGLFYN